MDGSVAFNPNSWLGLGRNPSFSAKQELVASSIEPTCKGEYSSHSETLVMPWFTGWLYPPFC